MLGEPLPWVGEASVVSEASASAALAAAAPWEEEASEAPAATPLTLALALALALASPELLEPGPGPGPGPERAGPEGQPRKQPHAARNIEFASWLVAELGLETLRAGGGVLDIAGGRGAVAFALQAHNGFRTTLVDPKELAGLRGRDRKVLRRQPADHPCPGPFRHVREMLDPAWASTAAGAALLSDCSAMVGCHPDEATEAIVDAALRYGEFCI